MTRRCDSSQPAATPLPCEATKPQGKCYSGKPETKNGRREKGTEHSSEWQDRQARQLSLPQISEGNGAREKGRREVCRKIQKKTKCESAGVEGERVEHLATRRSGPVVTPGPPARSAGRYSRESTEESRLSSKKTTPSPLPLRAQFEQFLVMLRQRATRPRREKL